ncbi:hypothetical protein D3C77_697210 [compost metagenome]
MTSLCAIELRKSLMIYIILSVNLPLESQDWLRLREVEISFFIFMFEQETKFPNSPRLITSNIAQIGTDSSLW